MTVLRSPHEARPTWTEAHRHACEVRYVRAMRWDAEREDYLTGVAKQRGAAAAQRLRRDVSGRGHARGAAMR